MSRLGSWSVGDLSVLGNWSEPRDGSGQGSSRATRAGGKRAGGMPGRYARGEPALGRQLELRRRAVLAVAAKCGGAQWVSVVPLQREGAPSFDFLLS